MGVGQGRVTSRIVGTPAAWSHVKAIGNAAPCMLGLLRHSAGTDCLGKEHRAGTSDPVMSTRERQPGATAESQAQDRDNSLAQKQSRALQEEAGL